MWAHVIAAALRTSFASSSRYGSVQLRTNSFSMCPLKSKLPSVCSAIVRVSIVFASGDTCSTGGGRPPCRGSGAPSGRYGTPIRMYDSIIRSRSCTIGSSAGIAWTIFSSADTSAVLRPHANIISSMSCTSRSTRVPTASATCPKQKNTGASGGIFFLPRSSKLSRTHCMIESTYGCIRSPIAMDTSPIASSVSPHASFVDRSRSRRSWSMSVVITGPRYSWA